MTVCARCGDCCDPVTLPFDPRARARERLRDPAAELTTANVEDYEFTLAHWRSTRERVAEVDGAPVTWHEVECDRFDRATRTCGAHGDRPPVCRGFPWYGRAAADVEGRRPIAESLSPRCSFNADVPGRRFLPLTVVTR